LREPDGLDHALRVFPAIETRDLRDDRQIVRDTVMVEPVLDVGRAQLAVLEGKRVDGRHDGYLRWRDRLRVFRE
jgi:hypothetical protein